MDEPLRLDWHRFYKLTEAHSKFSRTPCVYVQTDQTAYPIRVGKASEGLTARYRGGTAYAIDAAMHGSSNLVFVAAVPKDLCETVEDELIWQGRQSLCYNNQGKISAPILRLSLKHTGISPKFENFEGAER